MVKICHQRKVSVMPRVNPSQCIWLHGRRLSQKSGVKAYNQGLYFIRTHCAMCIDQFSELGILCKSCCDSPGCRESHMDSSLFTADLYWL
jgi:hypothetical protein